jgi:predicted alpha/beta hydrolase family esterase
LPFQAQIETVAEDLQAHFWRADAQVVANSFGGYLFLHASLSLPPFPGRVLLLSPIVGAFEDSERAMNFVPPRAEPLMKKAAQGLLPSPASCEIWVGSDDWQSVPQQVEKLGATIGAAVTVVQGRGHLLGEDVVGPVLDRWLKP